MTDNLSFDIKKLPPNPNLRVMHTSDATYCIDNDIKIQISNYDKGKMRTVEFNYYFQYTREHILSLQINSKKIPIYCQWYCSKHLYLDAVIRLVIFLGYDIRNIITHPKVQSNFTLTNLHRLSIVDSILRKYASFENASSYPSDLPSQLTLLGTLNPEYVHIYESAKFVETLHKNYYDTDYIQTFHVFSVISKNIVYKIYVLIDKFDMSEENLQKEFSKFKYKTLTITFYIREFNELVWRPHNCADLVYHLNEKMYVATFHSVHIENQMVIAVLEKFGQVFSFGRLDQIGEEHFSLRQDEQYLLQEGTMPLTEDETQLQYDNLRISEKKARDERKALRLLRPKELLTNDQMSDQEKEDLDAERKYIQDEEFMRKNNEVMKRIIASFNNKL